LPILVVRIVVGLAVDDLPTRAPSFRHSHDAAPRTRVAHRRRHFIPPQECSLIRGGRGNPFLGRLLFF
jgi:hypothetical protein